MPEFTSETAKAAKANQKRGRSFKVMFREIMQEKLSPVLFEKIKDQLGLSENIEQGEAAARSIIAACIEKGDVKSLTDILKITNEYTEKLIHEGDVEKPIAVVVGRRRIKGEYEEIGNNKETQK